MNHAPKTGFGRLARHARMALTRPHRVVEKLRHLAAGGPAKGLAVEPPDLGRYAVYARRARHLGLDDITLFLSFDCDTDLDPKASLEVMALLGPLGIKATFAVPGTQLERGAAIYRRIAGKGAEFMNHGHLPHTEWRGDRHVGITFYETMPCDAVEADIRRGHDTVAKVIGTPPLGFRAAHFGHFQKPDQLALVHRIAATLGYRYCSTTLPAYGLEHGPVHRVDGIAELATFGSLRCPVSILDSWSHLSNRCRYALSPSYEELLVDTVEALRGAKMPALLTWYVDPCHVAGQAPFERAMRYLAGLGIASLSGTEAAALAAPHR